MLLLPGVVCCPLYQLPIVPVTYSSKNQGTKVFFFYLTLSTYMLELFYLHADLQSTYFLTCSRIFCEDLDVVTYSFPETYTTKLQAKLTRARVAVINPRWWVTFTMVGVQNDPHLT